MCSGVTIRGVKYPLTHCPSTGIHSKGK
ncbi:hypothetical protein HY641_02855 [Candidatus Woesearchaeota archaeon]|nr:hypothetical protein [Candidatus Woesearchaeota archaeon]